MRRIAQSLLALSILAAGCGGKDGPLSPKETREVISAQARWNSSPVRSAYTYEIVLNCFCGSEVTTWNTVTVIDGAVVNVVSNNGTQVDPRLWTSFPTIDRLFALLLIDTSRQLVDIRARFDAQYGYPVEASFEYSPEIQDAGLSFSARNLRPVALP
jgi:hypothetical protein